MISSFFHAGSGMGDQLFRFVTSRTLAEKKGVPHGMETPENFKGLFFMKLPPFFAPAVYDKKWEERALYENGLDIRSYDPEINFVEGNTVIDGTFEDSKYWGHNLQNIRRWLEVEPLVIPDDTCVINYRGGEYATVPDLYLPITYWEKGVRIMIEKGMEKFEVHTDDPDAAWGHLGGMLPEDTKYLHEIGRNWRSVRFAKYAIIANSAFAILPRNLKHFEDKDALTIAPRGWARRNLGDGTWARPSCYYPSFNYV